MKILIVGQVFYPDNFRINDIVKELAKSNEVKVVTGLPDYDLGEIPQEYRFFKKRKETFHGAEIIRVPIISRRKGPIFRSLNYISFVVTGSLYTFFLKEKFDVVFSFQTSPITMFVPGLIYAKKNKVRSVLYTLDLWPESVKAMNFKENTAIFSIIQLISTRIYHGADLVLTSSPSFVEYLSTLIKLSKNKIEYLPQYTDEIQTEISLLDGVKEEKRIVFTFAGNLGLMQDLEVIVKAVEIIKDLDFIVNIVGSGSNEENMKELIKHKELEEYFVFHGRKNHDDMDAIYKVTDICIITLKDEGFIGKTIPGKLQTYMAKGKAIVGAISNDTKDIIEKSQSGLCVESGNYKGLADKMISYINNPHLIEKYGKNSFIYYNENYTRQKFMKSLLGYLRGDTRECLKEENYLSQEEQDHLETQFLKDS